MATTVDWGFEPKVTNLDVMFVGPEGKKESMNMQENEEDPRLVSDAKSIIRSLSIIEISDSISNQGEEHSGEIFFGGIWWHPSWAKNWDLYDGDLNDWYL